jgi:uncharacterized protein
MRRTAVAVVVVLVAGGCQAAGSGGAERPVAARPTPAAAPAPTVQGPSTQGPSTQGPSTQGPTAQGPTAQGPSARRRPGVRQATLDARLRAAAWDNDLDRARRLVATGADVDAKDATEQSAYLISTSEGYLRLLNLTLRNGADVHSLDRFDGTGLIRAAERGHADVVGRLLQTRIRVNHVNNLGWTALHEAIVLGDGSRRYVDTVRLLVAGGADLDLPSRRDGVRPLQHARRMGFDTIAAALRAGHRARRLDRAEARTLLLGAARRGNADGVAVALRAGAPLDVRNDARRTPLLLAATHDRVDVARLLVKLGADPDALDRQHDSAWLVTGVTGSVPMAEVLLRARPDLGLTNRYGGTSLIPASERGHVAYVRRVVRTGVDVDHVNDIGWTALLEAVILGDGSAPYQRVVRILLRAGADPTLADADGVTPLQHARARGYDEIAALLRRAAR